MLGGAADRAARPDGETGRELGGHPGDPALAELEAAWLVARADAGYRAELSGLQRDFCGRPTPLLDLPPPGSQAGRGSEAGFGKRAPMSLNDLHRKPGHLIRRLQQIAVALEQGPGVFQHARKVDFHSVIGFSRVAT